MEAENDDRSGLLVVARALLEINGKVGRHWLAMSYRHGQRAYMGYMTQQAAAEKFADETGFKPTRTVLIHHRKVARTSEEIQGVRATWFGRE